MPAWQQAKCGACSAPIGVSHPLFTTRRDTGYPWLPFAGCRICGGLRCAACAAAQSNRCHACGDELIADEFPIVWLNQLSICSRGWCIASPGAREKLHKRSADPLAPWWSCLECASELCDPCARERGERCRCGARVVLGGVPAAIAYLPSDLRAQVRDERLPLEQRKALLVEVIRRLEAEWQEGLINGLEYQMKQVYEAALRELGSVRSDR